MNLTPTAILVCGYLAMLAIGAALRWPIHATAQKAAIADGGAALIALTVFVTFNDVRSLAGCQTARYNRRLQL
jgi:membrane-associated protease RseP (regulator of RpoE activity)